MISFTLLKKPNRYFLQLASFSILLFILTSSSTLSAQDFKEKELYFKVYDTSAVTLPNYDTNYVGTYPQLQDEIDDFSVVSIKQAFPFLTNTSVLKVYRIIYEEELLTEDSLISRLTSKHFTEYAHKIFNGEFLNTPNDYNQNIQWWFDKMGVTEIWNNVTLPAGTIKVAVIDDAFNIGHLDLRDNIYKNTGEIPNNNIDDDNNGFVDDYIGFDFGNSDNDVSPPAEFVNEDNWSHGTHVAGIISAINDNTKGVSSIGGDFIKIIPIKLSDDIVTDPEPLNIELGVAYALNTSPDIINMSLKANNTATLELLISTAPDSVTFVASAGNSNDDMSILANRIYPASYPRVISVGATDKWDKKSSFSNYGDSVDIFAPGVGILSTVASGNTDISYKSGTSMATPFVASICGLIKLKNPSYNWENIKAALQNTAEKIDYENPDYIGKIGAGRVNAYFAIEDSIPLYYADFRLYDSSFSHQYCKNTLIQFQARPYSSVKYEWTLGSGIAFSTFSDSSSYFLSNVGMYDVTLTLRDSATNNILATRTKKDFLFIQSCDSIKSHIGNWIFGEKGYIDFSSGKPTPNDTLFSLGIPINEEENSLVYSDSTGNLLFFNGPSDTLVYDKNYTILNNSLVNVGNPSQGFISLKVYDEYYFFQASFAASQSVVGLHYYRFDPNSNLLSKPIPVNGNLPTDIDIKSNAVATGEVISLIPKCDNDSNIYNDEYWLITHGWESDANYKSKLLVFSITYDTSLNTIEVNYHHSDSVPNDDSSSLIQGALVVSPNGKYLIRMNDIFFGTDLFSTFDIFEINRTTGSLTFKERIEEGAHSCSFSPNSRYLYTGSIKKHSTSSYITQYDMNSLDVYGSRIRIPTTEAVTALQLGPDNKLYANNRNTNFLGVINKPNERVTLNEPNNCEYNPYGVKLDSGMLVKLSLPNFMDAKHILNTKNEFQYTFLGCKNIQFEYENFCDTFNYLWDFGVSGITTDVSTLQNPTYTYTDSGDFTVSLILYDTTGNPLDTITETITVLGIPLTPTISKINTIRDTVCKYETVEMTVDSILMSHTFSWQLNSSTINGATNQSLSYASPEVPIPLIYNYTAKITNSQSCTSLASNTISIFYNKVDTTFTSSTALLICPNKPAYLTAHKPLPIQSYIWQADTGTGFYEHSGLGSDSLTTTTKTGSYRFIAENSYGCVDTSATRWVRVAAPVIITAPLGSFFPNQSNPIQLENDTPAPIYNTFAWFRNGIQIPAGSSSTNVYLPGTYTLIVTSNECGIDTSNVLNLIADCGALGGSYDTTFINGGNASGVYVNTNGYAVGDNDTLVIQAGDTATFLNTALVMGECSMILVESTGWLKIDNTTVSGCSDWKGIVVLGDSTQARFPIVSYSHGVVDVYQSYISDADVGVLCHNGGFASLRQSRFENNYIHWGVQNYDTAYTDSSYAELDTFGRVKENLSCSHPYFNAPITYTALSGDTVDFHHAIFVKNSQYVLLANNIFEQDLFYLAHPCCPQTIYNNRTSISAIDATDIAIENNSFNASVRYGIHIKDCREHTDGRFYAKENTFTGASQSLNGYSVRGVLAETTDDLEFYENTLSDLIAGFVYYGGDNRTVLVKQNLFQDNTYGLVTAIERWPLTSDTATANTGTDSIRVKVDCNKFYGNYIGWGNSGNVIMQGDSLASIDASNEWNNSTNVDIATINNNKYIYDVNTGSPLPALTFSSSIDFNGTQYFSSIIRTINRNGTITCFGTWKADPTITSNPKVYEKESLAITAYPNPFGNYFMVEGGEFATLDVTLFDILGKEIQIQTTVSNKKVLVNTQFLSAGMYVLHINDGLGNTKILKLVKATY